MDITPRDPDLRGQESTNGSNMDQKTMARLGKVQELRRRFGPIGILGFASVLGAAWQGILVAFVFSLGNGGPTGTVVVYLVTIFGLLMITLSLAEMGSIAPTAGGQYHWVSEFAPAKVQKSMSFLMGWITVYAWLIIAVSSTSAAVKQIQGLVVLFHPIYVFPAWQTGLMTIATLILETSFNIGFATVLQYFEVVLLILHIAAFIVFEAVVLALGPHGSRRDVFDNWINEYHWPTLTGTVLVGILGPIAALTTADSVVHMAEELKDSAKWLPRTMISNALINYTISFLMLLTILFRAGDINAALATGNPMPYIAILANVTKSRGATLVLVLYVFFAIFFSTVNMITTSSRQLYAFARDGGVPFPKVFAKVNKRGIPFNSILMTLVCNVVLALILTGSDTAFQIVSALSVMFLMCSYMMSIGCVTFFRLRERKLPERQFSLGFMGLPINMVALVFAAFAFILLFFPVAPQPTLVEMNWSCVLFSFLVLFAGVLYLAGQRRVYVPPVALLMRKQSIGDVMLKDVQHTKS